MRTLYLDTFSGIAGDMFVAALVDLGAPPSAIEWELSQLNLPDYHTHFERATHQGINGVRFTVHASGQPGSPTPHAHEPCHHHGHSHETHDHGAHEHHDHGHSHDHPHPPHRPYAEIRDLLQDAPLSPPVQKRALSIFRRIAEAEAKIHGIPVDAVAFHEVGAIDSIVDIVAAAAALHALRIERVLAAPPVDGRGFMQCAHGRFPVPAPATLEVLRGIPLRTDDLPFELITPTGAAILADTADAFGPLPPFTLEKIGYGLGTRSLPDRPNVLRALLGTTGSGPASDVVTRIDTNLDDFSPELAAAVTDRLFAAGALDVTLTPIQMKKGRPAFELSVLAPNERAQALAHLVLTETSAFGLRLSEVRRLKLDRQAAAVTTPFGEVAIKIGLLDGHIVKATPEFESVKALATRLGIPLRTLHDATVAAIQPLLHPKS
jgi:uncharacterized protein (TIGR00299 family) protein